MTKLIKLCCFQKDEGSLTTLYILGEKMVKSGHWCVSCHRRLAPGFLDTWRALVPVVQG